MLTKHGKKYIMYMYNCNNRRMVMNTTVYNKKNKFLIPIIIILLIPTVLAIYFSLNPGAKEGVPSDIMDV